MRNDFWHYETPEFLEAVLRSFSYDPNAGIITWNDGCGPHTKRKDGLAFATLTSPNGYLSGNFKNQKMYASRVAWALHYREWPDAYIDHINRVKADNRISNLRVVSAAENLLNREGWGASKALGVGKSSNALKPWKACIKVRGNTVFLGNYATEKQAIAARRSFEMQLGIDEFTVDSTTA